MVLITTQVPKSSNSATVSFNHTIITSLLSITMYTPTMQEYVRDSLDQAYMVSSHTVSFSSWTEFHVTSSSLPLGALKASVLRKATGTKKSFSPPTDEWIYLGVEQPIFKNQPAKSTRPTWRNAGHSTATPSSTDESFSFQREPIQQARTDSLLSMSLKASHKNTKETAVKSTLKGMTSEDLPSVFDSDNED